jgi:hypothetical protein
MIIACTTATTVPELIEKLQQYQAAYPKEVLYVKSTQMTHLRVDLQENILTDGSITHDVILK